MDIEILALELLRAHVRTIVMEFGSWDHMERLFDADHLVTKACAMLGVSLESIRDGYYREIFGEDYKENDDV